MLTNAVEENKTRGGMEFRMVQGCAERTIFGSDKMRGYFASVTVSKTDLVGLLMSFMWDIWKKKKKESRKNQHFLPE